MDQNVRPDFYENQYLGAEDLDGVVEHGRVQLARHGLGAHTWGIAAGLELRERKMPSGDVEVSITPGVAWDGYYRAVVVPAPAVLTLDKFVNFVAATPPSGQLIKVWLRYTETAARPPAPGFEMCRLDGQFSRVVESFAIEVGDPIEPHGSVTIAGRSIDARKARSAFVTGAPDLFDESVPHQVFPLSGSRPLWLIPLGYVRWLKDAAPGRLIARDDTGAPPDSDLIREFRQYVGAVTESITAADGLIRLRDRGKDPDPAKSRVRTPRVTLDPKKPTENDLVWVEGNLHVLGDARVSGGKAEFRNANGDADNVPLAIRRIESNGLGGKDLQIVLGAATKPAGAHTLAVGSGTVDATSGQLTPALAKGFVVRDDGHVGVGIGAPPQLLTLGGDNDTRLEIGRISPSLPWGSLSPTKINDGSFTINQQSEGSTPPGPGADFALMRDRRLRLVLLDHDTRLSSQGGDVIVSVNYGEVGELEGLRVTLAGKVVVAKDLDVKGTMTAVTKAFLIAHPLSPESKQLVHVAIEGPEAAVFYRGTGRLANGRATITLPAYFEALTRAEQRTVLLTPIVEGDEPASALAATGVKNGQFSVRAISEGNAAQPFCWEVKAIRADVSHVEVERDVAPETLRQPVGAGVRG